MLYYPKEMEHRQLMLCLFSAKGGNLWYVLRHIALKTVDQTNSFTRPLSGMTWRSRRICNLFCAVGILCLNFWKKRARISKFIISSSFVNSCR